LLFFAITPYAIILLISTPRYRRHSPPLIFAIFAIIFADDTFVARHISFAADTAISISLFADAFAAFSLILMPPLSLPLPPERCRYAAAGCRFCCVIDERDV